MSEFPPANYPPTLSSVNPENTEPEDDVMEVINETPKSGTKSGTKSGARKSKNPFPGVRKRDWCFTIHFPEPQNEYVVPERPLEKIEYMIYQVEKSPTTGSLHLQGFVYYKQPKMAPTVITDLNNWAQAKAPHILPAKGTANQNQTYCSKTATYVNGPWEYGKKPHQGQRNDITDMVQMVIDNQPAREIFAAYPTQYLMYKKRAEDIAWDIKHEHWVPRPRNITVQVHVIVGDPGTGKSTYIRDRGVTFAANFHSKNPFAHYEGQHEVAFEEFNPSSVDLQTFLRLLEDPLMTVQILFKGNKPWCPRVIYITCNSHPGLWYQNATLQHRNAVERRLTTIQYWKGTSWENRTIDWLKGEESMIPPALPGTLNDTGLPWSPASAATTPPRE